MSDTPETDDAKFIPFAQGGEVVDADFARKLERERDEAREAAAMWEKVALREASMNGSQICGKEAAQ